MPSRRRAGFTLVELLVALVIFVLVAASLYRVLNVSQRTARTQTEKATMQGSLRSGLQLAMAEIQELWSDDDALLPGSAITAMTATALSYNAMRGLGMTCGVQTNTTITLRLNTWTGLLFPAANQGIYVFDEGALSSTEDDDLWHNGTITAVGSGSCPDGGAATVLTVSGIAASYANVKVPGPVRNHEPMQLGVVASGGRNWLGIAGTGSLTPLAGPLKSSGTALDFKYYNAQGVITTVPAEVKSVVFRLYGETDRMTTRNIGGTMQLLQDSMIVRVQLRNGR
jgi:prepilin-type N-terminal cleavage/methylation domain-containing protein